VKKVAIRFHLAYCIDHATVAADASQDGIFPLGSNVANPDELRVLHAYQRRPAIKKRFSQFKTDFEAAPVFLKAVHRIQALLAVDFLTLWLKALSKRELRQAMQGKGIDALPLYPERCACRWPIARRGIHLFELVQRHTLTRRRRSAEVMVTELRGLQRGLLERLGLSAQDEGG
jgi:hypothetical protein